MAELGVHSLRQIPCPRLQLQVSPHVGILDSVDAGLSDRMRMVWQPHLTVRDVATYSCGTQTRNSPKS